METRTCITTKMIQLRNIPEYGTKLIQLQMILKTPAHHKFKTVKGAFQYRKVR